MRGPRINLKLPESLEHIEKTSLERPSSRTDKLVEASFDKDSVPKCSTPKLQTCFSSKTLTSVGKLKDLLQKTSDKLKNIQTKNEPNRIPANEPIDKSNEIAKLKREVRLLEMEKKELETANKKLQDSLSCYRDISSKNDNTQTLARYAKFFLSAVKQDPNNSAVFRSVFNNEDEFLAKLNSQNLTGLCVGLFQFSLDTIQKTGKSEKNGKMFGEKNINDDTIKRIFLQSQDITENIVNQKKRIEQAYCSVKDTILSGKISFTPTHSRPQSVASESRNAAETPKSNFAKRPAEKSRSLKENGSDTS